MKALILAMALGLSSVTAYAQQAFFYDDPTLAETAAALTPAAAPIANSPRMIRELNRVFMIHFQGNLSVKSLAHLNALGNTQLFRAFNSDEKTLANAIKAYGEKILEISATRE